MNRHSFPLKLGLATWAAGVAGLLLPFAWVGESWGLVWINLAAPWSFIAEGKLGIRGNSYIVIGFVSVASAGVWALLVFGLARWLGRGKNIPNRTPTSAQGDDALHRD